ncbi:hypothetical protein JQ599_09605 [Bradyrhizobium diazoefficiens]|nr:hypothetical protein [Bradyrhizobium diazoefficiens]MBR0700154.1 hypothetical protein [Bradyrhizobium diazoefficiens]MBR0768489.1 hypothetical protein [Bradyrhizobium diazoefficiens]
MNVTLDSIKLGRDARRVFAKQRLGIVHPSLQLIAPLSCRIVAFGAYANAALIDGLDHLRKLVMPDFQLEDLPLQVAEKSGYRFGNILGIFSAGISLCLTEANAKDRRGRIDRQIQILERFIEMVRGHALSPPRLVYDAMSYTSIWRGNVIKQLTTCQRPEGEQ